ncbi:MAG: hypothetical protein CSA05_02755 [Bacteroidia bacterium]|nr:MAG: hypothetical protein CSA05_02755 [Bacteroidia bacterium]
MKFFTLSLLIFFLLLFPTFGQTDDLVKGGLFLNNFNYPDFFDAYNTSVLSDENGNVLFTNKKGIVVFNGQDREIIKTPKFPMLLFRMDKNKILLGADNEVGLIQQDKFGKYKYTSLNNTIQNVGRIRKIVKNKERLYFFSNTTLTISTTDFKTINQFSSENYSTFLGIFTSGDKTFITVKKKGIYEISDDELSLSFESIILGEQEILFHIPLSKGRMLLGMANNSLFEFDGVMLKNYLIDARAYISSNKLIGGLDIDGESFMLYTQNGGCIIVDKKKQKMRTTINYKTGLPDDEVFAACTASPSKIWITHAKGISFLNLNTPITTYDLYPGFEGDLLAIRHLKNKLYLGTSKGLYYLKKVKDYTEIQRFFTEKRLSETIVIREEPEDEEDSTVTFRQKWKKTKRIWGWGDKEQKQETKKDTLDRKVSVHEKKTQHNSEIYALHSVKKIFKKINKINAKITVLCNADSFLLAGTNNGIFAVSDTNSYTLLSDILVHCILQAKEKNVFYVGTNSGLYTAIFQNKKWEINRIFNKIKAPVFSVALSESMIALGSVNRAYIINIANEAVSEIAFDNTIFDEVTVVASGNEFLFLQNDKFYTYNFDKQEIQESERHSALTINRYLLSDNNLWYFADDSWKCMGKHEGNQNSKIYNYLNVFDKITFINKHTPDCLWIISNNKMYRLKADSDKDASRPKLLIKSIETPKGESLERGNFVLNHRNDGININVYSHCYTKPEATKYSYFIKGLSRQWTAWSPTQNIRIPHFPSGNYTIEIKAKNVFNHISENNELKVVVRTPFWKRWWFFLLLASAVFAAGFFIVKIRESLLRKENRRLEGIVEERTQSIIKQKNEIEKQHDLVVRQHESITDSINYAKKIQQALFPIDAQLKKFLPEHFVFFQPKEKVSGDFYWFKEKNDKLFLTVADCTGHGVPGAFMSILGISAISKIVSESDTEQPNEILEQLREEIKNSLKQNLKSRNPHDGMDVALCSLSADMSYLEYSGAYNPLYLFRKNSLRIVKADRQPIAVYLKEREFTNNKLELLKGDVIYMFTDGFADQFGGESNKKFGSKNFKTLLQEIHTKPLDEQLDVLKKTFDEWKGNNPQVDDITIVGFRI